METFFSVEAEHMTPCISRSRRVSKRKDFDCQCRTATQVNDDQQRKGSDCDMNRLWAEAENAPAIRVAAAIAITLRADEWNALKKRWREIDDITSFIKDKESFGAKRSQHLEKNSEPLWYEQRRCHKLIQLHGLIHRRGITTIIEAASQKVSNVNNAGSEQRLSKLVCL